jgi:ribosome biogenesis ATPase
LQALGASIKLASDVNLHTIAHDSRANGFSGADCAALLREAGLAVLRDGILGKPTPQAGDVEEGKESTPLQITSGHFQYAFDHVLPSVSKKDQARYDKLRDRMARARTRSTAEADTVATHGAGVEDSNASDVEKGV